MTDPDDPDTDTETGNENGTGTGTDADLHRPHLLAATPETRYLRDDVEFSRATAYFDATYALATTLLVTTLDPGPDGWSSWANLRDTVGDQLIAFVISFAVVAAYWWTNHTFVASLKALSPRVIGAVVVSLVFIVLLPFTTEGMAESGTVATVVYALNVALVSASATTLYVIAWNQQLFRTMPSRQALRRHIGSAIDTPIVFVLSIPIAIWISPVTARWCWLLLFPSGVLLGRWNRAHPISED